MKGNNFVTAGQIRKKSETFGKIQKGEAHEGENFCDSRTSGKGRKNPDNSGNERNMKGINFFHGRKKKKSAKSRGEEHEGEQFCDGWKNSEKSGQLRK